MPDDLTTYPPLDPLATARVMFSGIYLFCINKATNHCEVLRVPDLEHTPTLTIYEVDISGEKQDITSPYFNGKTNISISVTGSAGPGVKQHSEQGGTPAQFDRLKVGDKRSFGWIMDFEREFCSGKEVSIKSPASLGAKIVVKDGTIYTTKKNGRVLLKRAKDGSVGNQWFGEIADVIAIDIRGNGVELINTKLSPGSPHYKLPLPLKANTRYDIIFDNRCPDGNQPETGDADLEPYYGCLKLPSGEKEFRLSTSTTQTLSLLEGPLPTPCPQTCAGVLLSVTKGLPDPG